MNKENIILAPYKPICLSSDTPSAKLPVLSVISHYPGVFMYMQGKKTMEMFSEPPRRSPTAPTPVSEVQLGFHSVAL